MKREEKEIYMKIRKAEKKDIAKIMKIYDIARQYMRENGNLNQWTNNYPQEEILIEDIEKDCSYICYEKTDAHEEILATFYFSTEEEPTYKEIHQGEWLNNDEYGVIHRLGVAKQKKGIASFCMNYCLEKCKNIKIDTHRDNKPMQKLLEKLGYKYCGIIYLKTGDERLAFQKSSS